jgi:hypothetical protein
MTLALAPALASPKTGPTAVTRCQCGGPLAALTIPAPTPERPRATARVLIHTDDAPTCDRPTPTQCAHPHCWSEIHAEPVAECVDGLHDCCSCCQD